MDIIKRIGLSFLIWIFLTQPSLAFFSPEYFLATGATLTGLSGFTLGFFLDNKKNKEKNTEKNNNNNSGDVIIESLTASNVVFAFPGEKDLTLTNSGEKPISVNGILFESLSGISIFDGDIADCQPIPANGGTCSVPLIADNDAYGNGVAKIEYNDNKSVATSNVSVIDTTLELYLYKYNESSGSWQWVEVGENEDIVVESEKSPRYLKYINKGPFFWQKRDQSYIDWKVEFNDKGVVGLVELEERYGSGSLPDGNLYDSECDHSSVETNESCVFTLTNKVAQKDYPGAWGELKITGKNIDFDGEINKNVIGSGGLEIVMNQNSADFHLGYRSLRVVNTVVENSIKQNVTINNVVVDISSPKIEYCDVSSVNCGIYKTNCEGTTLAYGGSCKVWFKALPSDEILKEDVVIAVEAQGTYDPGSGVKSITEIDEFKIAYEQSLYVGGSFAQSGGQLTNQISKWNGTSWASLGAGTDLTVNALANMSVNSDLYVGGNFGLAGGQLVNRIARWNGSSWRSLIDSDTGAGGANNGVYALAEIDEDLYVGGNFVYVAGTQNPARKRANRVARWDSLSEVWSPLTYSGGNGVNRVVRAVTNIGDDVYVGGDFTYASGMQANRVAKWDPLSGIWSPLTDIGGNGVNGRVRALANIGNDLYVGGDFRQAGGQQVERIAKWNGSLWAPLTDVDTGAYGVNSLVYAFVAVNNDLYVGGNFSYVAGTQYPARKRANRIAQWDSLSERWSPLVEGTSNGVNGRVYALINIGNDLYVGGDFSKAGGQPANHIAKWNLTSSSWSPLGQGIGGNNGVRALVTSPSLLIVEHLMP